MTGIGVAEGVECLITANDPTVRGGASNPWSLKKALRANDIALANRLPCISLGGVGSADCRRRRRSSSPGERFSATSPGCRRRGSRPSPSSSATPPPGARTSRHVRPRDHGQGAGEGLPGRAAAGEDGDRRGERRRVPGRRQDVPRACQGLADYFAVDSRTGRPPPGQARRRPAQPPQGVRRSRSTAKYDEDQLLGIIPGNLRHPFDPREVIARVVDSLRAQPGQFLYGTSLTTGWATLHGYPVGILANTQGVLFSASPRRPPSSSSSPTSATSLSSSCTTPPATWSARSTSRAGSSSTAR